MFWTKLISNFYRSQYNLVWPVDWWMNAEKWRQAGPPLHPSSAAAQSNGLAGPPQATANIQLTSRTIDTAVEAES